MRTTLISFLVFVATLASYASYTIGFEHHPENNAKGTQSSAKTVEQHDIVVKSYESELAEIYKAASRLEKRKEREPKDSAAYVDLDKNLADIYARMHLAEKYLGKLKKQSPEINENDRKDLEFVLSDVREIINWNSIQSE